MMETERTDWEKDGDGCNDCGQPARWNEAKGWYEHIDPNAAPCFLMGSAQDERRGPAVGYERSR